MDTMTQERIAEIGRAKARAMDDGGLKGLKNATVLIFGLEWQKIQDLQQGKSIAKILPPVDKQKMREKILSDMKRFGYVPAGEVKIELGI